MQSHMVINGILLNHQNITIFEDKLIFLFFLQVADLIQYTDYSPSAAYDRADFFSSEKFKV